MVTYLCIVKQTVDVSYQIEPYIAHTKRALPTGRRYIQQQNSNTFVKFYIN